MKVTDTTKGLTVERLRYLLDYNPLEGVFRWKNKPSKNANNISMNLHEEFANVIPFGKVV